MNDFNIPITTSVEQSLRLVLLGLKKETADMYYTRLNNQDEWELKIGIPPEHNQIFKMYVLPAWTLGRLIEIYKQHYKCEYTALNNLTYDNIIEELSIEILNETFNRNYLNQTYIPFKHD